MDVKLEQIKYLYKSYSWLTVRLERNIQKGTAGRWSWLLYYSLLPYRGLEITIHSLRNIVENVKENKARRMPESKPR